MPSRDAREPEKSIREVRISGLGPASAGRRLRYDPGSSIHTGFAAGRRTIHTDALYASKAREFIERAGVDTVMIEDTSGILTPERARTLIPAIKAAIGERPLALHTHNLVGLAQRTYVEAVEQGVGRAGQP